MKMQLFWVLSILLPLVSCDTIKINSPTPNQVINNSSFLIDYLIERNNGNNNLFVTNTTTQLLDERGNSLVSFGKNLTNSTMVRLDMRTFVQPNTVTNFTVKITAFGNYSVPVNGRAFGEVEVEVPLQLNLRNSTNTTTTTTTRPTTPSSSTTTTTTPATSTNATPTSSPTVQSGAGYERHPHIIFSMLSVMMLFLI